MIEYVCMLMGYELLVVFMSLGLNCEILEFWWKMIIILKTLWIDVMNPWLMCFDCSFDVC